MANRGHRRVDFNRAAQVGQSTQLGAHGLVADGDPHQPHALLFQNIECRHGDAPLLNQAELPVGPLSPRMQGGGERGADHLIGLEPGEGGTTAPELVDAFDG